MSEKTIVDAIKAEAGLLIVVGIATVVLGVICMMSPLVAGVSIALLAGVILLVGGIGQCFFAFRAGSFGPGLLTFVLGALTVVCGLLMVGHPLLGLKFLTLLLIIYFVSEGILEVITAFQVRPMSGWGWMVFSGVVSIILGVLIWRQWPLSGAWAIGILVGIKLLFLGSWMLSLGIAARRVAKQVA